MSREIKFRGYHTGMKRMASAEELAADQLTLLTTGAFINVSGVSTVQSIVYPRDQFIPLQFTGLNDDNGIEMYEGDIIERINTQSLTAIEWNDDICEMQYSDGTRLNADDNYGGGRFVIGNIYENPELLQS